MIKNFPFILLILIFLNTCGFKIINTKENNYKISKIENEDKNIESYKLKNKLKLISNLNSSNEIDIKFNLSKEKLVSEKNINNEITKYDLIINVKLFLKNKSSDYNFEKDFSASTNYGVGKVYSENLNSERIKSELLIEKILNDIRTYLNSKYNL